MSNAVTATIRNADGILVSVSFRSFSSSVLGSTLIACELIEKEHGFVPDINKIELCVR